MFEKPDSPIFHVITDFPPERPRSSAQSTALAHCYTSYGAVFFGVPNDGLDIASFIPIVGDGPNRSLIESLRQDNSKILYAQRRRFSDAFDFEGSSEIYFSTRLAGRDGGCWTHSVAVEWVAKL